MTNSGFSTPGPICPDCKSDKDEKWLSLGICEKQACTEGEKNLPGLNKEETEACFKKSEDAFREFERIQKDKKVLEQHEGYMDTGVPMKPPCPDCGGSGGGVFMQGGEEFEKYCDRCHGTGRREEGG